MCCTGVWADSRHVAAQHNRVRLNGQCAENYHLSSLKHQLTQTVYKPCYIPLKVISCFFQKQDIRSYCLHLNKALFSEYAICRMTNLHNGRMIVLRFSLIAVQLLKENCEGLLYPRCLLRNAIALFIFLCVVSAFR